MQGTIYKIQNTINNKVYIGQTIRKVQTRWSEHKRAAYSDDEKYENIHLYKAMRKYGIENFDFSIIEYYENIELEELNKKEIYWIEYYNSYQNGYNMTLGGNNYLREGKKIFNYEEIQELWLNNKNLTQSQLAKKFGCCTFTIYKALSLLPEYTNNREVGMYNDKGELLKKFFSTRQASYEVFGDLNHRSNILQACNEKAEKAYGYTWHYLDTNPNDYFQPQDLRIKCIETNIIYNSISEASQITGIDRKGINRCILKQQKTAGGYHWCKAFEEITIIDIEKTRKMTGNAKTIKCIETEEVFPSINQAKQKYKGDIKACLAGRQKTAGGYHWEYVNKETL